MFIRVNNNGTSSYFFKPAPEKQMLAFREVNLSCQPVRMCNHCCDVHEYKYYSSGLQNAPNSMPAFIRVTLVGKSFFFCDVAFDVFGQQLSKNIRESILKELERISFMLPSRNLKFFIKTVATVPGLWLIDASFITARQTNGKLDLSTSKNKRNNAYASRKYADHYCKKNPSDKAPTELRCL